MSDPTDTPSTDGAPKPRPPIGLMPRAIHAEHRLYEIEAAIARYRHAGLDVPQEWVDEAAGLRVVPEDRPAHCPNGCADGLITVGDGDEGGGSHEEHCPHLWHDEPAGVPALDDDTRREVLQLVRTAQAWAVTLNDNADKALAAGFPDGGERERAIALVLSGLAAYLGGTDGR